MKNSEYCFSPKEEEMFKALGLEEELTFAIRGMTSPFQVYQWAVNKCFLGKVEGPAAESLRRLFDRFGNGTDTRLTPEWDNMINLEENTPNPVIDKKNFGKR